MFYADGGSTLKEVIELLSGLMICSSDYEFDTVLKNLNEVRNAKITTNDLSIAVDYTPLDTESEFEEQENIARLIDIIESVELHGFSLAS